MPLHVTLKSVGNPDFGQNAGRSLPGVPTQTVAVADLAEASKACRDYIAEHGLGGGNWAGGRIVDENKVEVGRVSYNGRVWPPGPHVNGAEPIWPPAKEEPKEVNPYEWETSTVELEGYGTFEIWGCLRIAHAKATNTFEIDGKRHDFTQYIHFSEDGSVEGPKLVSFMKDGRYDLMGGNARAEKAIAAAVKAWAEDPANFAMILRNEIKDNMRDVHRIDTIALPHAHEAVRKVEAERAESLAKAEAAQERLIEVMGSGPRP